MQEIFNRQLPEVIYWQPCHSVFRELVPPGQLLLSAFVVSSLQLIFSRHMSASLLRGQLEERFPSILMLLWFDQAFY